MAPSKALDRTPRLNLGELVRRHRTDLVALTMLTGSLVVVVGYIVAGGTLVGLDAAVELYPLYIAVGERLANGDLPLWNLWQSSGIPLAADPQSGWLYLPVMALFTIFPFTIAVPLLIAAHLALAGFGAYALARSLRISPGGALVAGIAFSQAGWFLNRVASVTSGTGAVAWLPIALLGVERAVRSTRLSSRLAWWSLAGFALSQSLAIWLGQGSYYVSLAVASYVLYRTLLQPPAINPALRARLLDSLVNGGAVFSIAFGFAAAGVLPRLEFIHVSNLADGYAAFQGVRGGWTLEQTAERLLGQTSYYVGGATVALAFTGLVLAGRRFLAPYWVGLIAVCLFLARSDRSYIHKWLEGAIPGLGDVQRHLPERIMMVAYLGVALLAGAAVSAWPGSPLGVRRRLLTVAAPSSVLVVILWLDRRQEEIRFETIWPIVAIAGLVGVSIGRRRSRTAALMPAVVVAVMLCDLLSNGRALILSGQGGLNHYREDLAIYYGSSPAVDFLRSQEGDPFRYFGYDPSLASQDAGGVLYRRHFGNSWTRALLVNNRATILRIADIQTQDTPVQIQRYVDFIGAINGFSQDYHEASIYPSGLDSPLLDLLNVRYVIVPNLPPTDRPDLAELERAWPVVYQDRRVKILENPEALPRVWLVHQARQVAPGDALDLLASGVVDARVEVLLEEPPPPLTPAANTVGEEPTVLHLDPERITVRVRTNTAGFLVFSEIAYPAWRAYVNDENVPIHIANHALRAVWTPAGDHIVELRFESTALRLGLAIGAATTAIVGGAFIAAWYVERRRSGHQERLRC